MTDALSLLIGGPRLIYVITFGASCAILQVFMAYTPYVAGLKWLNLGPVCLGTVIVVEIPWAEAARGFLFPTVLPDAAFWTTVVALLGTTISPYLFFWQAAQEVEDIRVVSERKPLVKAPRQGPDAIERIQLDTYIGMAFSNLVAFAIIVTTAATLHAGGVTDLATSSQATEALPPVAGPFHPVRSGDCRNRPARGPGLSGLSGLRHRRGPQVACRSWPQTKKGQGLLRDPHDRDDALGLRSTFRRSIRSKRSIGVQ
jgi:Mn2+/Fe2+ NRAMP family transporter